MINGSTVFMMVFSESWFNRIIALLKKNGISLCWNAVLALIVVDFC